MDRPLPSPWHPSLFPVWVRFIIPTMIMVGEYDTLGTLATANKLEQEILNSRKIVLPGTAHMIPLEQPARFNQTILDFLKSVE